MPYCLSNTGCALYRCFTIYSNNSSSRDKCNNFSLAFWLFCYNTLHHFQLEVIYIFLALNSENKIEKELISSIHVQICKHIVILNTQCNKANVSNS